MFNSEISDSSISGIASDDNNAVISVRDSKIFNNSKIKGEGFIEGAIISKSILNNSNVYSTYEGLSLEDPLKLSLDNVLMNNSNLYFVYPGITIKNSNLYTNSSLTSSVSSVEVSGVTLNSSSITMGSNLYESFSSTHCSLFPGTITFCGVEAWLVRGKYCSCGF